MWEGQDDSSACTRRRPIDHSEDPTTRCGPASRPNLDMRFGECARIPSLVPNASTSGVTLIATKTTTSILPRIALQSRPPVRLFAKRRPLTSIDQMSQRPTLPAYRPVGRLRSQQRRLRGPSMLPRTDADLSSAQTHRWSQLGACYRVRKSKAHRLASSTVKVGAHC